MNHRAMTLTCGLLFALGASGCGAMVSPDAATDGGIDARSADAIAMDARATDASDGSDVVRRDELRPFECNVPADCAAIPTPSGARFSQGWSCVGGQCTYAVVSGESCDATAARCAQCSGQPAQCEGSTPCPVNWTSANVRFEFSNCARNYVPSIRACFGHFVMLDDGMLCLLTDAPTGAIRYVLNCGMCESVFMVTGP